MTKRERIYIKRKKYKRKFSIMGWDAEFKWETTYPKISFYGEIVTPIIKNRKC